VLGQERAVEALQFGVAMPRPGYNVFVMGEPGTGRFSFVKRYLKAEGKRLQTPADWVYVNNFDEPREPAAGAAVGQRRAFIGDINGLIDNLLATFPAVFEHPSYQQKKSAIDRAFNQRYDKALDVIERLALEKDVACTATAATSPSPRWPTARRWTRPSSPSCRKPSASASTTTFPLEERLNEELASLPQWKRESNNQLRQLNEETITLALQPLLSPLSEKYAENAAVCGYLQAMQVYLLTVVEQLVDDSKTDAVAASCWKSSTRRAWWSVIRPAAVRRWCSSRTRPTKTCLAASNTAPIKARCTPPIASCARGVASRQRRLPDSGSGKNAQ
jgi:hypothetical protein